MIKALIVEDSASAREHLRYLLESDSEIEVVGVAKDGLEAIDMASRIKPSVITMDINMPNMNGLDATRKIMETNPVPIVIVSALWNPKEVETTFRSMEAGAVAIVEKPRGPGHPDAEESARNLVQTVKAMAEVKVVRRWASVPGERLVEAALDASAPVSLKRKIDMIAIGASTGGPLALKIILSSLPKDFQAPIVIVQHIAKGFTQGFVDWVNQSSTLPVHLAIQAETIQPGHVYIAPDGIHMKVARGGKISLIEDPAENCVRPSVSYLFRSVAEEYGSSAVGVLLTGMGKDGAKELKAMRDGGAITIAQDKETSIVHGMPGEAIKLGAAAHIMPLGGIATLLEGLVKKHRPARNEI